MSARELAGALVRTVLFLIGRRAADAFAQAMTSNSMMGISDFTLKRLFI
jgi:hypothetical protein